MTAVVALAPETPVAASSSRGRRGTVSSMLIAVMVMVGVSILLYPTAAGWFSQLEQSQRVDDYDDVMTELGPEGREAELAAAAAYNQTLTGGALIDPYGQTPLSDQRAIVAAYEEQLNLGPAAVMARIRIPAIGVDLPIYHGTDEETLRQGIGHLLGSAMPVGGAGTHSVLTGHRGLPESVLFSELDQVQTGDVFELDVYGEILTYEVGEVQVIEPGDTDILMPESGRDLVTLVTCTPLGINSHRIIVTGERIPTPAADSPEVAMPDIPGDPWWAVGLAGGFAFAAAYRSMTSRPRLVAPARAGGPTTGIIG
ncbi:class C sortase [Agrococcus sp. ARC_14]|uniref:class C sortase n=1 Tax=Agrococcus sp. ARC_14 TaxID=2919927 RepID=UPI001F067866|nr:class C sortase [Agrococcus sp. ARC_14]MCH1881989.1 class C sortase [Agrococcus sp. ARC_14]